ncbi:MAG: type II secretion system protein [Oscillospiraceae bacterium]|nr:type II secretion system protein [Oscillospiraceae bacterium]
MTHFHKKADSRYAPKGFTLIEMTIVMGIIGILLAVFVPTIGGYITNSKLNAANANARVLFNAAQTVCQEFEFLDRNGTSGEFYGTASDRADMEGSLFICVENGTIQIPSLAVRGGSFTNGEVNDILSGVGTNATTNPDGENSSFMGRMNRLVDSFDEMCWTVYIEGYKVRGVFAAKDLDSEFIGSYPERAGDPQHRGFANLASVDAAGMAANLPA